MDNDLRSSNPYGMSGSVTDVRSVQGNRVLRNTYALLAVSLIPTILGALIGVQLGLGPLMAKSPVVSMLVFFGVAIALMFGIERNKNSGVGVALLLGFTFFMGVMLSQILGWVLGFGNGADLIMLAFGGTAVIFGGMATLAASVKRDLSGLAKWMAMGALLVIVGMIANMFLQIPALQLTMLVLVIGIFSVFMLIDVQRVINGGETNYISATLAIYLDLYNVFTALLQLLGIFGGSRD